MARDLRDNRGITIIPPIRPVARPVAQPQQQAQAKPSNVWELGAKMAQENAGPPQQSGGGMGGGLGFMLNNPVTKNILKPLEVLDYGRRLSILGQEYAAKALPDPLEWLSPPSMLVDESKSAADPRSAWERFRDPSYGWGQISKQIDTGHGTLDKWLNRGQGLVGDVALDPLTYLTFGAAPLVEGTPTIGRAARFSRMGEAADALRAAGKLDEPAIAMLRRVGERGYSAADEEMLRALGLQRSGARLHVPFTKIETGRIPGSGGVARSINTVTGTLRGAVNRGDKLSKLIRSPKELELATETLTRASRGTSDDFLAALTDVQHENLRRAGEGFFKGMGSEELKQRSDAIREELNTTFNGDLGKYLDATELDPNTPTQLNALSARMREIAAEKGVEIPELQGMGYLPHVLSPEFRELLHEGGDRAKQFMNQTGIVMNDTLRESGFLRKRALRPDPGTTLKIQIGDHVIELKTGSINEINQKVKELFPELKTSALETDPMTMFERYIPGTAHDVGNRYAINTLIERGNPFVYREVDPRYEPRLAARDEARTAFNRIEQQIQMEGSSPDLLKRRRVAADKLKQAEADLKEATHRVYRGQEKPFQDSTVFRPTLNVDETIAANEQIYKRANETVGGERAAADLIRQGNKEEDLVGLGEELQAYRSELRAPMSARSRRIPGRIQRLEDRIADITKEGRSVAWQKRRVRALATQTAAEIQAEIDDLTQEIGALPRRLRSAAREEQRAYIMGVKERMDSLQSEAEHLRDMLTSDLLSEIEPLQRPLKEAQAKLDAAMERYQLKFPEGATPEEIVARAEAQPSGFPERQMKLIPDEGTQNLGSRPLTGAMEREATLGAQAQQLPPEAAAQAQKHLAAKADVEAARAEARRLQDILDRPEFLGIVQQDVAERLVRLADAGDVETIRKMREQLERLSEMIPAAKQQVKEEAIRSKLSRAQAKAQRLEGKAAAAEHPRIPVENPHRTPPEIEALRAQVEQEQMLAAGGTGRAELIAEANRMLNRKESLLNSGGRLAELRNLQRQIREEMQAAVRLGDREQLARLRELQGRVEKEINKTRFGGAAEEIAAKREQLSQLPTPPGERLQALQELRTSMDKPGNELARRARAVSAQLPATQQEYLAGLRGEGVVGHIGAETEREITSKTTSMGARKSQLEQALQEIPDDVRRELDNIQAQQDELKAYANQLASEQGALLNERTQLRAALDASPTQVNDRMSPAARHATRGMSARDPELIKTQPLNKVIDEIEEMARLNPGATDEALNVTEAQLQMYRRQLEQAAQHDLKANQAADVAAAAKDNSFVKIYTAMLRDGWKDIPGQDNVFVREELRRMMQNAEQASAQPGLFGSTVQALTNFFKTYATLSPGFHVRNALSATFMNTSDGVALRAQLEGVNKWRAFVRAADPLEFYKNLEPEWQKAFDSVFATGAGGRFFESGVAQATAIGRTRLKEGIFRNKATILSQRAGQRVEGSVRLGMAFDTLRNGGTVEDAINRITRVHFDYSQVSKFDENMKRLIPFWTFMSRNLPLQFTQMWMKPKVYNWYRSLVRNVSVPAPEFTPEYITQGGGFNTGAKTPDISGVPIIGGMMGAGMPIFASPDFSQNRYEDDVARFTGALQGEGWGQLLSDFNPYLTAPLEYATDTNLFTGRHYAPDDYRKASGVTDMAMLPLMMLTNQVKRGPNGEINYSEKGVDAYRSMIPILDRISRLAPQSAGGQGSDRQMESIMRFLGIPVRTISEDQLRNERRARVFDAREQRRLQQALSA